MKLLITTNAFRKDVAIAAKRGYSRAKLDSIVRLLVEGTPLPARCRPHKLGGRWSELWECHIAPDWLLIYETSETQVVLHRTGTHSDLF